MKVTKIFFLLAVVISSILYLQSGQKPSSAFEAAVFTSQSPEISFYGVEIRVSNIEKSVKFYGEILGFAVKSSSETEAWLDAKTFPLKLTKVPYDNNIDFEHEAHAKVALQVNSLLLTIDKLREHNVKFSEKELSRNGIGIGIPFEDPFGNMHSLAEVQIRDVPEFEEPRIYNTGFTVSDVALARKFYVDQLGFEVFSENYLPAALPLKHKDNSFAFMIHYKENCGPRKSNPDHAQVSLIFSTPNLKAAMALLKSHNVAVVKDNSEFTNNDATVRFADPFGNESILVQLK